MKRNALLVFSLTLTAALAASAGAAERVYKWTDADGVVHFSANPPSDRASERVKLPANKSPTPAPADAATAPDGGADDGRVYAQAQAPDNSAVERENRRRRCEKGRNMITQIEPRPRVYRLDEDGNQVYLDDQERLDLLDEARQLVADNCG